MLTRYNDNHKSYHLIDVDTNCHTFNRDVVFDEEFEPFQLSSLIEIPKDQPL